MDVYPSARLNPDLCSVTIWQLILPTPVFPGQLPDQWCTHGRDRYGGNINSVDGSSQVPSTKVTVVNNLGTLDQSNIEINGHFGGSSVDDHLLCRFIQRNSFCETVAH